MHSGSDSAFQRSSFGYREQTQQEIIEKVCRPRSSARLSEKIMYAVIRTGGKQYRVAPGDVLNVEKLGHEDGSIEFSDVLATSGQPGELAKPASAKVLATVVEEGRAPKILVFHFKRKKQYKKMQGHRQAFTRIRISEIVVDGTSYKEK